MSIGGSLQSVSIRGRLFPVAADADASIKLGGFEKTIQMNGDGTARTNMVRVNWHVTGIVLSIDDDRDDMEFLKEIQDSTDPKDGVDITVEKANGRVWQGKGTVLEAVEGSTMNSTASVSLGGGGELTQQ